jgi:FKBP-type peptidyl-prolyl cis-trans isomerase (trigger factor)
MEKHYENLKKLKAKDGEAEFELEIPVGILETESKKVITEIARDFKMPGFRPGKVPENIVQERVDRMHVLEEAAGGALREIIKELITDEELSVIGSPRINITKIAIGSPVALKIFFALAPEVTLPDYKKVGRAVLTKEEKVEATEAEVEESLKALQRMFAPAIEGKEAEKPPELNDEFVKQFGPFKDLAAFKEEMKKNIVEDKKAKLREVKRDEIIKEIVKHTKIGAISQALLDEEYEDYVADRDENLKAANMTLAVYLKEMKKTPEELDKEMKNLIKERMKTRLVVRVIQKKEGFKADHDEVHRNMERLKQRYPDRDSQHLHNMAEAMILNEKFFALFEEGEKK